MGPQPLCTFCMCLYIVRREWKSHSTFKEQRNSFSSRLFGPQSQCHPARVYPPKHKRSKDSELVLQVLATTLHSAGLLALVLVVLACFNANTISPHHHEGRCQRMLTHANIYVFNVYIWNIILIRHEDHEASFSLEIEMSVFVFNYIYIYIYNNYFYVWVWQAWWLRLRRLCPTRSQCPSYAEEAW